MTLNINGDASERPDGRTRRELVESLLDEMTPWNPHERMSAFRSFLSGSLSLIHVHVLTILEVEGPLPMGRLAEELDVSVASATGIVSRMEQRRLVVRRHDETDRRIVSVHPTGRGSEVFARLRRHRQDKLKKLLSQLSDAELTAFLTGLRAIRRARAATSSEVSPTKDPGS
ncbi:MAG TPA: MarR family transcriptional regulator [Candidatus Limnocylindrales bacterium]|nr:MarR family transcriptional regulator [Candidatus Limnocylindrales bacterium]